MGKKLVGRDSVEQYLCHDEPKIYVDRTMILSPGAKDYLREKSVTIVYGTRPESTTESDPNLETMVVNMLKNNYGIDDEKKISEISALVRRKLNNQE